jgi:hypothetical protein
VEPEAFPDYYLQNVHHQTDGYLSDHSAALYDLQVEILFHGAADPMRRRLLKPLVKGLAAFADASMQAATCVFLLHKLPAAARANVLREAFRVLEPGRGVVLADSVQLAD